MNADSFIAIQSLIVRYCQAHDAQNAAAASACFSKDATYLGSGPGPEALREGFQRVYETRSAQRRHVLTNFDIRFTSKDAATVVAIEQMYTIEDGHAELTLVGRYYVEVVLEDSEWKIQFLEPRMDTTFEFADTPQLTCKQVEGEDGDTYYVLVPSA
ncbi:nuclear transport factor 2 family protein (plasmid) [Rhodococcus sp. USK10]|uniref:nuclear transport factor 2 family protein n=1 Tax=Rhodococcus sp. USK10 TaxID=2789739 RepID=UPI001C5F9C8C|nr:nuclear transport factor 2 family protein [Rhodococcus sp. USK10]QYB00214.1 nuclear transport factor 2 family protein [Rhodococcus sp. USK10]